MVQGKQISDIDRRRVLRMRSRGDTGRHIADILGISKTAVYEIICSGTANKSIKKRGRKVVMSERTKRRVLSVIRKNRQLGMRSIASCLRGEVSASTIWRIKTANGLSRRKFRCRPTLREHHKEARIKFGAWFLQQKAILDHVVWTDEKRFSLDGPDGYQYYWWEQGRSIPDDLFKVDSFGKRGIMVHLAFSVKGLISIEQLLGSITGPTYSAFLTETLLPRIRSFHGDDFIFQQDNARPHTSGVAKETLEEEDVEVLKWPALSPDLNPVENLWGIIARKIYTAGELYENEKMLWDAVRKAAEQISDETFINLATSLPNRIEGMLLKRGGYAQ